MLFLLLKKLYRITFLVKKIEDSLNKIICKKLPKRIIIILELF
jgi:hypothetical protein